MKEPISCFDEDGFPEIIIYKDHFKIKSTDFWDFRTFQYTDIKAIKYYNPNNNWYTKLAIALSSITTRIAAQKQYHYIKITKKDGANWKYSHNGLRNSEISKVLRQIEELSETNNIDIH